MTGGNVDNRIIDRPIKIMNGSCSRPQAVNGYETTNSVTGKVDENNAVAQIELEPTTDLAGLGVDPWKAINKIKLNETAPEQGWKLPNPRGRRRLFGEWTIGDRPTAIRVVVDIISDDTCFARIAVGDDCDFTNKPDCPTNGQHAICVTVPYRLEPEQSCWLFPCYSQKTAEVFARISGKETQEELVCLGASIRIAKIQLNGRDWSIALSDDNADGIYGGDPGASTMFIDRDGNGRFEPTEALDSLNSQIELEGRTYWIDRVSTNGRLVAISDASISMIEGHVQDAKTGVAIPDAYVSLGESRSKTDEIGNFQFKVPCGPLPTLTISAKGFVNERFSIPRFNAHPGQPISLALQMNAIEQSQLTGECLLRNGEIRYFLSREANANQGDFSTRVSDGEWEFHVNPDHDGFRSIEPLGDIRGAQLEQIDTAAPRRSFRGIVKAIEGHAYRYSHYGNGNSSKQIYFQVIAIGEDYVRLKYLIRFPGQDSRAP